MLNVPMTTDGGVALAATICEMKLDVMPMMAIMLAACRARVTLKVAPRAPFAADMMIFW